MQTLHSARTQQSFTPPPLCCDIALCCAQSKEMVQWCFVGTHPNLHSTDTPHSLTPPSLSNHHCPQPVLRRAQSNEMVQWYFVGRQTMLALQVRGLALGALAALTGCKDLP